MEIKTLEQARELGLETRSYGSNYWQYIDNDKYYHLMKDDKEILPDVKKLEIYEASDEKWRYSDTNYEWHTIERDNIKIKTIKQAEELGLSPLSYDNGDWQYEDEDEISHLIRDGEEIAKGRFINSFENRDYDYEDENGVYYYMSEGKVLHSSDPEETGKYEPEIKNEKQKRCMEEANELGFEVYLFYNGDWEYGDENGIQHLFRGEKEIAKGKYVNSYNNGDYEYQDEDGIYHLMRDNEEIFSGNVEEINEYTSKNKNKK